MSALHPAQSTKNNKDSLPTAWRWSRTYQESKIQHSHSVLARTHGQTYRIPKIGIAHAVGRAWDPSEEEPPRKKVTIQVCSAGGGVPIPNG